MASLAADRQGRLVSVVFALCFAVTHVFMADAVLAQWHVHIKTEKWEPTHIRDLSGEYEMLENFSGTSSLHLRAYEDRTHPELQFFACLITSDDMLVKPKLDSWYGLKLRNGALVKSGVKELIFEPIEIDGLGQGIRFGQVIYVKIK